MRTSVRFGRWSKPRIAGHGENGERGFGAAGIEEHGWGEKRRMAEEASEGQLRTAAGRAVGFGHRHDRQAALRASAGRNAGYNPGKPGRPSHAYHSSFIANLRIVLDVEVQAGNQTASSYAQPELWELLDGLPEPSRPAFVRGDCAWGTERAMEGAEQRTIAYLFKLKQTTNVKKLIDRMIGKPDWVDAGQGWQGLESELHLSGWTKKRRVVLLRRPLREKAVAAAARKQRKTARQLSLDLSEATYEGVRYEYAVLVTSMQDEVRMIAQLYRDRGDSENNFDELKNQWDGQDLPRRTGRAVRSWPV